MADTSDGEVLYQTANASYRKTRSNRLGRSVYGGIEWGAAVAQTMAKQPKEGRRKTRRAAAEETTARIFDKARGSTSARLERVAACVGPEGVLLATASGESNELELMAQEIYSDMQREDVHQAMLGSGTEDLISGLFDLGSIISIIMSIIQAIRACKNPLPTPAPA